MLVIYLQYAVLLIVPLLVAPFTAHSGPSALVGGCFLGQAAFLAAWASRSQEPWLIKMGQANRFLVVGWLAVCGGQLLVGRRFEPSVFLLPLGLFFLATVFTLLQCAKRRKLQLDLREAMWWMTIFALVAAMSPVLLERPDAPAAAILLLVGVTFRLFVFSSLAALVAVPTLVLWARNTALRNKGIGLALVCLAGATLQVMLLRGLGLVTGAFVGSVPEIFVNGLCFDFGVVVMLVGSLMLNGGAAEPLRVFRGNTEVAT